MSAADTDPNVQASSADAKGPIAYFAQNRVAANVLMVALLVVGLVAATQLAVQTFPDIDHRTVVVRVPSPGSSPQEVEQDINRRIEESVIGNPGVDRVVGTAIEGLSEVRIEVAPFADPETVLDDIKNAVDRIENFPPVSAEQPEVLLTQPLRRVMTLSVSSSVLTENQLRLAGEDLRDHLLSMPGISQVSLIGVREREITIELSEEALRRNGLTISEVANAVRQTSLNLTAGELRTDAGGVVLQTLSKGHAGADYEDIPLITRLDGTIVRLGEVADVLDGFSDQDLVTEIDGVPAVLVRVDALREQSVRAVSEIARGAIADYPVPQDTTIAVWEDVATPIASVLMKVVQLGLAGVLLVFISLVATFDLRVAFWIAFGVPLSFIGALVFFEPIGLTFNTITIFALFMLVGIVVDDAVVVGENIAAEREKGRGALEAAVVGARSVVGPISIGLLTTVIAFIPFLFLASGAGALQWLQVIPFVVFFVLLISLVEVFFILPAHLSHEQRWSLPPLGDIQSRVRSWLDSIRNRILVPVVSWAVRRAFTTILGSVVLVLGASILVSTDTVRWVAFERGNFGNNIQADLELPVGTPVESTRAAAERLAEAGYAINDQLEGVSVASISILVGDTVSPSRTGTLEGVRAGRGHVASVRLHLNERPLREVRPDQIERAWRQNVGNPPELDSVVFHRGAAGQLPGVAYALEHDDPDVLLTATRELRSQLENVDGLYEITDSLSPGKRHFDIDVTDLGHAAGLTPAAIAGQLRANFHGTEVQRIQRGRDEIKVMVRYPPERRSSIRELTNELIRRPGGAEVPLSTVAHITEKRDFATLTRIDGNRAALLSALADPSVITPVQARRRVAESMIPQLMEKFPGLKISMDQGARVEQSMYDTLIALVPIVVIVMYALMAGFLRSYWKPIVAIAGIPVAFSGAVFSHLVLGWDFTAISLFGAIGIGGIIVNDALVLLDRYNTIRQDRPDLPAIACVSAASQHRFRAVFLTSMTTLLGLSPMLFERADELIFLVPLVVSMFGGLVFSTVFILIFLPALVMVVEGRRE